MRASTAVSLCLAAGALALGVLPASAQTRRQPNPAEQAAQEKPKSDEWTILQGVLPNQKNAGPCPYVKVLYDAARYLEFKDGRESAATVQYTGEINGVEADCQYKTDDPIKLRIGVIFDLGRGPEAQGDKKTYRYWVAVTRRNSAVLAKEYFQLPVDFNGKDRVRVGEEINGIVIPRANKDISGSNFEVLVGFDVTPQMAAFNREGKRFRIDAVPAGASSGQ